MDSSNVVEKPGLIDKCGPVEEAEEGIKIRIGDGVTMVVLRVIGIKPWRVKTVRAQYDHAWSGREARRSLPYYYRSVASCPYRATGHPEIVSPSL